MKLKYKSTLKNIFIRILIAPALLLLAFGLITYHIYLQHEGFFTLRYPHNEKIATSPLDEELHAGDIFKGQIKAEENYLGIIGFKFDTFDRINHDVLTFRLREKGKKSWYYQRDYQTKLFYGNDYYTIGFPKIIDSKNKTYEFEFQSIKGTYGDSIAIRNVHPLIILRYEIPKSVIFSNKDQLLDFLKKKFLLEIKNSSLLFAFIIYFFPLFFYLSWLLYFEKHFKKEQEQLRNTVGFHLFFLIYSKYALLYLMLIALFIDIVLMQETYDLVILVIFILWILVNFVYKAGSNLSFVIAIAFVIFCAVLGAYNIDSIATKFALWTYIFLWYGILVLIWESIYKPKKQLQLQAVYQDLRSDSLELIHFVQKRLKKRRKIYET